jgi:prepilin-type N-terminal cleavage/methylation domain-containing protein/prepilin-type processing-associated H-X9-DG protein
MLYRSHVRTPMHSQRSYGFTLVELLVVIGIIAVLIAILMPTLAGARQSALAVKSMSNLRQLGLGLTNYVNQHKGFYPMSSSLGTVVPRTRWADYLFPFMQNTEVYMSPLLSEDEQLRMNISFAHTVDQTTGADIAGLTIKWGGYGYNYQYLGNSRQPGGIKAFHANASQIKQSSLTIALADTNGSKDGGANWTSHGVYAIDPPLMSIELGSKGSRSSSAMPGPGQYSYRGGNDGDASRRATPAERNRGKVNVLFCDGHGEAMKLASMDDFNGDGVVDNGWWNGMGNPNVR